MSEHTKDSFLSKELTNSVKGIAAVLVLFHHFYQRTYFISQPYIGKIFELLGYLAVSIFFFFSGYGLQISYDNKGDSYIKHFPKNRLLPFYLIYVLLILISIIKNLLIRQDISFESIISSFFFFGTIVTYGWYFQKVLLFYIVFYAIYKLVRNEKARVPLISLIILLFTFVSHFSGAETATYVSSLSFILGIYLCKNSKLKNKLSTKGFLIFCVFGFLCLTLNILSLLSDDRHLRYIPRIIASPCFVICIMSLISIIYKKKPTIIINKITSWLGKNSLEIYAIQGMFFDALRSNLFYIQNSYVYIILTFLCTIAFAPILHTGVSWIRKTINKYVY